MIEESRLDWPLPQNTLSPSAITKFVQCPEAFRQRYILGRRDISNWSGLLGNTVHRTQQINLGQKIITGRDLSMADLDDVYDESWTSELDDAGGPSEINWESKNGTMAPAKAKDTAIPIARMYHDRVAPTIQPIATEYRLEVRIPGIQPKIIGYIDVVKELEGKIDMKFGAFAAKEPKNDWRLQAMIYNLADEGSFEWHTGSWGSDRYGPAVRTPEHFPALRIPYTPEDRRITIALVSNYVSAMAAYWYQFGPDDPWPGEGRSHMFACDYCPFHPEKLGGCTYWPRNIKMPPKEATLV